ncbi:hypothetical protein BJ970_004661 [Saccharopolyspora phatthalungensis]|uniref:Uncharacterized protein n=1 Tax=Saccharopolyspora phatthalungensis TaxID=664693 RepID=A0A840QB01_9PSEU|nr:hypothetical protein [Saccharopolyspora phatthalungensis]
MQAPFEHVSFYYGKRKALDDVTGIHTGLTNMVMERYDSCRDRPQWTLCAHLPAETGR